VKKRSRGRELALQLLYQMDLRGRELAEEAPDFLAAAERSVEADDDGGQQDGERVDRETRAFAQRLVLGVRDHWNELDTVIRGVAQNWDIGRMAVIDRNVLRLATYELLHCRDIPPKVAINEAIELGKRYSTANSGAFINGILDKIKSRREAGGEGASPAAEAASGGAQG
jgi:N utilization substance protein B